MGLRVFKGLGFRVQGSGFLQCLCGDGSQIVRTNMPRRKPLTQHIASQEWAFVALSNKTWLGKIEGRLQNACRAAHLRGGRKSRFEFSAAPEQYADSHSSRRTRISVNGTYCWLYAVCKEAASHHKQAYRSPGPGWPSHRHERACQVPEAKRGPTGDKMLGPGQNLPILEEESEAPPGCGRSGRDPLWVPKPVQNPEPRPAQHSSRRNTRWRRPWRLTSGPCAQLSLRQNLLSCPIVEFSVLFAYS